VLVIFAIEYVGVGLRGGRVLEISRTLRFPESATYRDTPLGVEQMPTGIENNESAEVSLL
jgi:hypothetical protein